MIVSETLKKGGFDTSIHRWEAVFAAEGFTSGFEPNDFRSEPGYEFHI